ncbi:MAG: N-acetylmuramoyl-L-alanine amidase [Lachnospiraceae bacterium]|jgi:N-acetylmuramoyl-L-alanine amidase|nr:N-acetylmuramoyl-L-alanine amidase [Lachnospiraceae bacterium]MEE3460637.1 N-acetylmuramoyl-L-alanine amidase [Lachnospiraceae bacterium]
MRSAARTAITAGLLCILFAVCLLIRSGSSGTEDDQIDISAAAASKAVIMEESEWSEQDPDSDSSDINNTDPDPDKSAYALNTRPGKYIVLIDAGHGGLDEGTSVTVPVLHKGKYVYKRYTEKQVTVQIVKYLKGLLDHDQRIEAYYTRLTDVSVSKEYRVHRANDLKADLFLSVHCNAGLFYDYSSHGSESLYMKKKNFGNIKNRKFGSIILNSVYEEAGIEKRKVAERHDLYILHHSERPSVIYECGYLTNAGDRAVITEKKGQQRIARGLYRGILKSLGM